MKPRSSTFMITSALLLALIIPLSGCLQTLDTYVREPSGEPQLTDQSSVARAQDLLTSLGYAVGPVDGLNGPKTAAAIKAFQRSKRLHADGLITRSLLNTMRNESISRNPVAMTDEVRDAQERDVTNARLVGGVLGAVVGANSADQLDTTALGGGAAGAAVGTILGDQAGKIIANRRGDYHQQNAAIDVAYQNRRDAVSGMRQRASRITADSRKRQQEIESLQQKITLGEQSNAEIEASLVDLQKSIKSGQSLARDLKIQIDLAEQDLQAVNAEISANAGADVELLAMRNDLTAMRDELIDSLNTINGITPELRQQQESLLATRPG